MMRTADPYLILGPYRFVREAPKNILPHLKTVRRSSEWRTLGFLVTLDEHGYPKRGLSDVYGFSLVREIDELVAEAIKTGKKAVQHPLLVFEYVLAGCDLSEFARLTPDVEAFCRGNLLRVNGQPQDALPLLEKAVRLNPDEVRYREVYYPLRLALGDLSSINEEFVCYERDIDTIIHAGRFDEWMKALISAERYSAAREIISKTETAIEHLYSGATIAHFYTPQKPDWYGYKMDQLTKRAEKFLTQIAKLEKKACLPEKRKRQRSTSRRGHENATIIAGGAVAEVVYDFTQRCFIGEESQEPIDLSAETFLLERLGAGPLTVTDVHQLPPTHRRLLRELLTQYIMFLEINRSLLFLPGFLEGSSKDQLGSPLLQYMGKHQWPFPQMLKRA